MTTPPIARKEPLSRTVHGIELTDDYGWLRAENWQQVMREPDTLPADIRDYLEAENAYLKAQMADTEALQETLFAEMKGRIKEDDSSVPSNDGPFAYYSSFVTGAQYPRLCRCARDGEAGAPDEQILLDGNKEAEGHDYWQLGGAAHSPDHKLLAYATDTNGSEYFTIRFRDLATGEDLPDTIESASGSIVWARDSRTVYYLRLDDNHRPLEAYRHTLGQPAEQDECIYREENTGVYLHISETQSGDFIVLDSSDHETSEAYLIDAHDPAAKPRLVAARREAHEYSLEHNGDTLYILTNSDGAEDFRICTAPVDAPEEANWRELIPHRPGTLILSHVVFKDSMVRLERHNSLPRIVIRHLADGAEHEIAFEEEAYSLGMGAGYEFDTTSDAVLVFVDDHAEPGLRLRHGEPRSHAAQDPGSAERSRSGALRHAPPARNRARRRTGADKPHASRRHADRRLGPAAALRLRQLRHRHSRLVLDGAPQSRRSWLRLRHRPRRGGKDKGYGWYTAGKREKKTNTFTDFIAAGEHLAARNYTSRGRIVAEGGSAGGMLMGAVVNMAPDLFLGAIANVPFVDVLNTILDETLPLTPMEWPEWGNPITSPDDFAYIRSYSPYDNVEAKAYPHILALGGLTDPRVTYWEPAKWVAKLRELNTSDNLVLLKTNMSRRPRRRLRPLRQPQGNGAGIRVRAKRGGEGLKLRGAAVLNKALKASGISRFRGAIR